MPMKRAWLIWLSATAIIGTYCLVGVVAMSSFTTKLKLEPGSVAELKVFRLGNNPLAMELEFRRREGDRRPELGEWVIRSDEFTRGFWKFEKPGAQISVIATTGANRPTTFEAMPAGAYGAGTIDRELTSNLAVERGVWRRQNSDLQQLTLRRGLNAIEVKVVSVESPLLGEVVNLVILPELQLKRGSSSVDWLWVSFFWPIFLGVQLLWVAILVCVGRDKSQAKVQGV